MTGLAMTALAASRPATGRLVWTGYAAAGFALLRLPVHAYYAMGGTAGTAGAGPAIEAFPDWLSPAAAGFLWRAAHLGTAVLLAAVAVLAVALVRPWGRRLPTAVLVIPAFVVTVVSIGYAGAVAVGRTMRLASTGMPDLLARLADVGVTGGRAVGDLASIAGATGPERAVMHYARWLGESSLSTFGLTGPLALAPWALLLGLLLAVAVSVRLGGVTARRIWLVAVALGVLRLML